jgi:hypothetical protein
MSPVRYELSFYIPEGDILHSDQKFVSNFVQNLCITIDTSVHAWLLAHYMLWRAGTVKLLTARRGRYSSTWRMIIGRTAVLLLMFIKDSL